MFSARVPFNGALKKINKAIKDWIPTRRDMGGYVTSKVLQGSQSVSGMLGYITKLPMRVECWNISQDDGAEGQKLYQLVKVDPLSGKRALNKSNFIKGCLPFGTGHYVDWTE